MPFVHRLSALAALFLVFLFAAGCGDGRNSAHVTGKITVKGKPLPEIGVNFEPSGGGGGSFGRTDASGNYTLRFIDNDQNGALIGKHDVTFRDLEAAKVPESDAGPMPKQKFRFPQKYMSEPQSFEVKSGSNTADFDLK